ncbi:MAG: FAS1-like dehydratase domain-containing protein [Nocardioidaceae bacterium]
MPVPQELVGTTMPPTPAHDVSRSAIVAFADAIGETAAEHRDPDAARGLGHPDVIAPPTYPIVVAFEAMTALMRDTRLGIELRNVVHGDQRFVIDRPVRSGDALTAALTIESVRQIGGADIIGTRSEISTTDGEHVCTAYATLAHRGGAPA